MSGRERDTVRAHLEALESWGIRLLPGDATMFEERPSRDSAPRTSGAASPRTPRKSDAPRATPPPASGARPAERRDFAPPTAASAPGGGRSGLSVEAKRQALAELSERVAACELCRLHESRQRTVFGVGNPSADLMFIGEAPGEDEDRQGEPFVGRAGQLLDRIIGALGLRREDVYIANVLKCRPPGNRNPNPDEVALCTDYLARQIELVEPKMIVALGLPASRFLLGTEAPLYRLRGRNHRYRQTPVVVTYHPAYLLRNPDAKAATWQDLQVVIEFLGLDPPSLRDRSRPS